MIKLFTVLSFISIVASIFVSVDILLDSTTSHLETHEGSPYSCGVPFLFLVIGAELVVARWLIHTKTNLQTIKEYCLYCWRNSLFEANLGTRGYTLNPKNTRGFWGFYFAGGDADGVCRG